MPSARTLAGLNPAPILIVDMANNETAKPLKNLFVIIYLQCYISPSLAQKKSPASAELFKIIQIYPYAASSTNSALSTLISSTNSISAIGAASPTRMRVLIIRVYPPGRSLNASATSPNKWSTIGR